MYIQIQMYAFIRKSTHAYMTLIYAHIDNIYSDIQHK